MQHPKRKGTGPRKPVVKGTKLDSFVQSIIGQLQQQPAGDEKGDTNSSGSKAKLADVSAFTRQCLDTPPCHFMPFAAAFVRAGGVPHALKRLSEQADKAPTGAFGRSCFACSVPRMGGFTVADVQPAWC